MKTKQIYIDLFEQVLEADNYITLAEFETTFNNQLNIDHKSKSNYYCYLQKLAEEISTWDISPGYYFDNELTKPVEYTLKILKMTPSELKQMELEKQAESDLKEYHSELPVKLLHLIAQAYYLKINIKYKYTENKDLIIEFSIQLPKENYSKRYPDYTEYTTYEETISLKGNSSEYWNVKTLIDIVQDIKNKKLEKEKLLESAKNKVTKLLTPEELAILKIKGL